MGRMAKTGHKVGLTGWLIHVACCSSCSLRTATKHHRTPNMNAARCCCTCWVPMSMPSGFSLSQICCCCCCCLSNFCDCPAGPMGPAGPPLLFCPFNVVWKVAVGVCKSDDHISATATCPHGTFLMSSGCAGYTKGCKPGRSPPVRWLPCLYLVALSLQVASVSSPCSCGLSQDCLQLVHAAADCKPLITLLLPPALCRRCPSQRPGQSLLADLAQRRER